MNTAIRGSREASSRYSPLTGSIYSCQFFYGGWFLFHGLNYWVGFYFDKSVLPGPGLTPALAASGVMGIVKALEIVIGLALLTDLFAALAIVAAWPITLMIAFVTASHLTPFGVSVAVIIVTLNAVMSFGHLDRYRAMLVPHAGPPAPGVPAGRSRDDRLPAPLHIVGMLLGVGAAIAVTYLSMILLR